MFTIILITILVVVIGFLWYDIGSDYVYMTERSHGMKLIKQRINDSWQALADEHNLIFLGGGFFKKVTLHGSYRQYYLNLELKKRTEHKQKLFSTYLTISSTQANSQKNTHQPSSQTKPVVIKDIVRFFNKPSLKFSLKAPLQIAENQQIITYNYNGVNSEKRYLQFLFDLMVDLLNLYPEIIEQEGDIVAGLLTMLNDDTHGLQLIAANLLENIANRTAPRLKDKTTPLICPMCLAHCIPHKIIKTVSKATVKVAIKDVSMLKVTHYGCRLCYQSKNFVEGQLVVVLDHTMQAERLEENNQLRINWFKHKNPFDFDVVEIKQASDEDVERFVVQIKNDTDPGRKEHYKTTTYIIALDCQLNHNTHRILERTFINN